MASAKDTSFIPDMPIGPLDEYRKRAKFDWKQLRLIFEEENLLRLKYKTWNKMEADPLFAKPKQTLSADQQKYRAAMQMNATNLLKLAPPNVEQLSHGQKTRYLMAINEALRSVCPSLSVKIALGVGLFNNALLAMGTERHSKYYQAAWKGEVRMPTNQPTIHSLC